MRLMKQKKYYQHPVLHSIILPPAQMICMSDVSQDEHELITVDLKGIEDWQPDSDEQVLIAHGSAKFMKNEGVELGYFAGKVHFVAQEQTQQSLICCVTTKRIVFIPEKKEYNFNNKFDSYKTSLSAEKQKSSEFVESVNDISASKLDSFWTSNKEYIPNDTSIWCELWVRYEITKKENLEYVRNATIKTLEKLKIQSKEQIIEFPERLVF